jgi:hypothetical protein
LFGPFPKTFVVPRSGKPSPLKSTKLFTYAFWLPEPLVTTSSTCCGLRERTRPSGPNSTPIAQPSSVRVRSGVKVGAPPGVVEATTVPASRGSVRQ